MQSYSPLRSINLQGAAPSWKAGRGEGLRNMAQGNICVDTVNSSASGLLSVHSPLSHLDFIPFKQHAWVRHAD